MYLSIFLANTVNHGATVINVKSVEIHWIALYANGKNMVYFYNLDQFQKKN